MSELISSVELTTEEDLALQVAAIRVVLRQVIVSIDARDPGLLQEIDDVLRATPLPKTVASNPLAEPLHAKVADLLDSMTHSPLPEEGVEAPEPREA